jgi:hypothetical protein
LAFGYALVASVVLGAAGAITEVLTGRLDLLDKIISTWLIPVAASGCGLACSSLAVRGRRILPSVGIALALAAAALQLGNVWLDGLSHRYHQIAWSMSFFAVACGHLAALSLARLARLHVSAMIVAHVLVVGVALLWTLRVFDFPWTPGLDQAHIIMMILDVVVTILIPFYHWRRQCPACDALMRELEPLVDEEEGTADHFTGRYKKLGRRFRATKSCPRPMD